MATVETTPSVKSYLGHPCAIAPALVRYDEPIKNSLNQNADSRALAQRLAENLQRLMDQVSCAHEVSELVRDWREDRDDGRFDSLLTMNAAYLLGTSNDCFSLVGMVLDLMQRADMVKPSQAEVAGRG